MTLFSFKVNFTTKICQQFYLIPGFREFDCGTRYVSSRAPNLLLDGAVYKQGWGNFNISDAHMFGILTFFRPVSICWLRFLSKYF